MTDLAPKDQIERIVGAQRHPLWHQARAVSSEQTVYVLHSERCLETTSDLRDCPYSRALDRGIAASAWTEDQPVVVAIEGGRLTPVGTA